MNKQMKNIIILILLCIIYTPIFLITLFGFGLSGIDYSCRFNDLSCIMKNRDNDIIVYLSILTINFSLILSILVTLKNVLKSIISNKNRKAVLL